MQSLSVRGTKLGWLVTKLRKSRFKSIKSHQLNF